MEPGGQGTQTSPGSAAYVFRGQKEQLAALEAGAPRMAAVSFPAGQGAHSVLPLWLLKRAGGHLNHGCPRADAKPAAQGAHSVEASPPSPSPAGQAKHARTPFSTPSNVPAGHAAQAVPLPTARRG
jgi:hypothetical protein